MEFILTSQKCEACNKHAALATEEQIITLIAQIPQWNVVTSDVARQLKRSFQFKNFKQALAFTVKVGEMAEEEGHHPLLVTEWGKVDVVWWSHIIGGLHVNDFIAAAKTDEIFDASNDRK